MRQGYWLILALCYAVVVYAQAMIVWCVSAASDWATSQTSPDQVPLTLFLTPRIVAIVSALALLMALCHEAAKHGVLDGQAPAGLDRRDLVTMAVVGAIGAVVAGALALLGKGLVGAAQHAVIMNGILIHDGSDYAVVTALMIVWAIWAASFAVMPALVVRQILSRESRLDTRRTADRPPSAPE